MIRKLFRLGSACPPNASADSNSTDVNHPEIFCSVPDQCQSRCVAVAAALTVMRAEATAADFCVGARKSVAIREAKSARAGCTAVEGVFGAFSWKRRAQPGKGGGWKPGCLLTSASVTLYASEQGGN
jgi:hypothetical protein